MSWQEFLDSLDDYTVVQYDYNVDIAIEVQTDDGVLHHIPEEDWDELREAYEQAMDDRREIAYWSGQ